MKIWRMNSRLDWTCVMSESDKTFSFMDGAIFDFTLVTVAMVTGEEYGLDSRERDISRLTPVKKMRLSIPKTDSVNVAMVSVKTRTGWRSPFIKTEFTL